jgi:hypothetical protein
MGKEMAELNTGFSAASFSRTAVASNLFSSLVHLPLADLIS